MAVVKHKALAAWILRRLGEHDWLQPEDTLLGLRPFGIHYDSKKTTLKSGEKAVKVILVPWEKVPEELTKRPFQKGIVEGQWNGVGALDIAQAIAYLSDIDLSKVVSTNPRATYEHIVTALEQRGMVDEDQEVAEA